MEPIHQVANWLAVVLQVAEPGGRDKVDVARWKQICDLPSEPVFAEVKQPRKVSPKHGARQPARRRAIRKFSFQDGTKLGRTRKRLAWRLADGACRVFALPKHEQHAKIDRSSPRRLD